VNRDVVNWYEMDRGYLPRGCPCRRPHPPGLPGLPDLEFFSRHGLRAACGTHNVARGLERLERQHAGRPSRTGSPPTIYGNYTRKGKAAIDARRRAGGDTRPPRGAPRGPSKPSTVS
jgi:hypothetical protein